MNLIVDNLGKIRFCFRLEPPNSGKPLFKSHKYPKILKTAALKKILRRSCGKVR